MHIKNKKILFLLGIVFFIFICGIVLSFIYFHNGDVVAWVANEKITKSEIDSFVEKSGSKDKKMALNNIIEKKIIENESKRKNITVTDEDIKKKDQGNYLDLNRFTIEENNYNLTGDEAFQFVLKKSKLADDVTRKICGELIVASLGAYLDDPYIDDRTLAEKKLNDDKAQTELAFNAAIEKLKISLVESVISELKGNSNLLNVEYDKDYCSSSFKYTGGMLDNDLFFNQVSAFTKGKWEGPIFLSEKTEKLNDARAEKFAKDGMIIKGISLLNIKEKKDGAKSIREWLNEYKKDNLRYNKRYAGEYY